MKFIGFFICFFIININLLFAKKIVSENPKLIVLVVIDQMRPDYIYQFWDDFGENGFKKIITEGMVFRNARYNYAFTQAGPGCATIVTGTYPSIHGIIADSWYDRTKEETLFCVSDNESKAIDGTYESGQYSPKWLLSSTISDEMRFFTNGKSKSFGIALDPMPAILLSGHNANVAYWFDMKSGKWLTGSYYLNNLPEWVIDFNNKKIPEIYISRTWEYQNINEKELNSDTNTIGKIVKKIKSFRYNLSEHYNRDKNFEFLKSTPYGNILTSDFFTNTVINEELGKDEFTDFISIYYSATGIIGRKYGPYSPEFRDAIIKLDVEIARLLNFLDENIGLENTLFIVTSDRGGSYSPEFLGQYKINGDYFNNYQALALLRSYLNVVYGKGSWVQYFQFNQLYLNHNLIENSKVLLSDFQNVVASFLLNFSGISNVITSSSLNFSNNNNFNNFFYNSYYPKRSGDIFICLDPGWVEKSDDKIFSNSFYPNDIQVPLMWYGWKIKRKTISRPIDMIDVAPSISVFLNLPFTNACFGHPIPEIVE